MKFLAAITAAILAVFLTLAVSSCNDYGNTFQGNTGVALAFVSPSNVNAGGPDLTISLTAIGGNSSFVVQTTVTWDQKALSTCVLTTDSGTTCAKAGDTGTVTQVTAVVPAALTAKPGTHFVQTVQPHSGAGLNGLSNPIAFIVNPAPNPAPTISSISPTSTPACGTSCTNVSVALTISGTNFLPTSSTTGVSSVNWNMGATQTTFSTANNNPANMTISATSIQLNIPGSLLANAGAASVTVTNPPLTQNCTPGVSCNGQGGGGTSPCPFITGSTTVTVCTFTITDPSSSGNTSNASAEEETPAVSSDGRYVAYAGSQNGHSQIFARDTCQGASSSCQPRTTLVSSTTEGTPGTDDSHAPSMSSDGRYVAFSSAASNLSADASTVTGRQVYLRDTCFGASAACTPTTHLVSSDPNGALVGTEAILPSVSASGRFVAFVAVTLSHASSSVRAPSKSASSAPNSGVRQVFVRDTCLGAQNCTPGVTRISLQPGDGTDSTAKPAGPAISGSADHVALAGGSLATVFTRSVAVDDNVFIAATKNHP
jgi:WD40-like Beta Propeller Repeat